MSDERPRIKGTTEEIGEIVPPIDRPRDDDDERIEIDDGEDIKPKDPTTRRR